jgi:hypothetical protein
VGKYVSGSSSNKRSVIALEVTSDYSVNASFHRGCFSLMQLSPINEWLVAMLCLKTVLASDPFLKLVTELKEEVNGSATLLDR